MADPVRGKLVWQGSGDKRVRRVIFPTKKGMSIPTPFDLEQLAASLRNRTEDEIEVDLEVVSGKPVRIRPVGESFAASPAPQPVRSSQQQRGSQQRGQQGRAVQGQRQSQQHRPAVRGAFHNPYNFVPALPRDGITGELGDHEPIGHHVLHPDRYTGVIRVKMTVKTPFLVPDAANAVDCPNDHKSFPVRVDAEGRPYIPPTSIKGMLRSAYEAVTNSRLAVFAGHEDRLADRMPANEGLRLVPARVVNGQIELLPGTSTIKPNGQPNGPMYAAWLPRYDVRTGQEGGRNCVYYPDNSLPQHGDEVTCWLVKVQHRSGRFAFWGVNRIFRRGQTAGVRPDHAIEVDGYVCITNRNIDRKHDERVFFTTQKERLLYPLTAELRQQWCELITNYQSIHDEELRAGMAGPPALNNSVWSRQVVGGPAERQLSTGTLCYAAYRDGQVVALYPVMISRRLFESSPLSLLPPSLRPATTLSQLSPADRVFGWVNQEGHGAYRGNLRIGPVTCLTNKEQAIENFGTPGLPLAILGQPKPQQARFYVAASPDGEAQPDGLSKEAAGYSREKGLRGRKVYPHHRGLPSSHWDNPMQDRTQQADKGHFQEYRRPQLDGQDQRDNQNRSIQAWVKPGTEFTFDIHVTNLSNVELGALLWLLSLPDNHFHRFGGGKPLGFGSVRLEIDRDHTHLHDGNAWKQAYSTLDDVIPTEADRDALIQKFQEVVRTWNGSSASFEQVSFIAAWLKMATGHADTLPTHYPRVSQQRQGDPVPPNPEGLAYEWFVANDRTGGSQVSLLDLAKDAGLPLLNAPR